MLSQDITAMDTPTMVVMVIMVMAMARERLNPLLSLKLMLSQDTTTPTTMEVMVIMVMAMARGKLSQLLLLKLMPSLDITIPTPTMVVMVITDTAMARGRLRLDTIMDTMDTPMVDMDMVMDMARGRLSQDITTDTMDTLMDTDMVMDTMVKQQLFICSKTSVIQTGHEDHFEGNTPVVTYQNSLFEIKDKP